MDRNEKIAQIRALPQQITELVSGLTPEQLITPYLSGEWTVAQNVHHLADSHINSYIRLKLIITDDNPTLRPYDQNVWAETPEARQADISASLMLLRGLHQHWADLFDSLQDDQWTRTGHHPEHTEPQTPEIMLDYYAAHGLGHLDQITRTLAAGGIMRG